MSGSSVLPREKRPYDVIVYGATGFTGKLVAQYIAGATGRKSHVDQPALKWAIAGRDEKKLRAVLADLSRDEKTADEPDIVLADASDQQSMQKMTASTRVVLSTVGPFARHGESLVAACVKTGTDYADSTGESLWVRQMIDKYSEAATKSGALIVSMCGFDSIPSDLTAYLAANELKTKHKTDVAHMQGYVTVNGGGVSGGTISSMLDMLALPKEERRKAKDLYQLNPDDVRPDKRRAVEKDIVLPRYDETLQQWTTPWLMAMVNVRVVRRSLALRKQLGAGFGDNASFNEVMTSKSAPMAFLTWIGLALTLMLIAFPPTRWLLTRFVLPAPGQGPSEAARKATRFTFRTVANGENGKLVEAVMKGGDPGYTDTAKFISEISLQMAQERDQLELTSLIKKPVGPRVGGFFTPAVVGGQRLAERLRQGGLSITVGEYKGRQ